jgi:hypothetical protein
VRIIQPVGIFQYKNIHIVVVVIVAMVMVAVVVKWRRQ